MWRKLEKSQEPEFVSKAIEFTGNHILYGQYMMKVIVEYPKSCEQFLTNPSINRQAWIGHAAANIAIQCPEYLTRIAWKELTEEQRILANKQADIAIEAWEKLHAGKTGETQLCLEF